MNKVNFKKELEQLINKHSIENGSNTPDFILAEYLWGCLLNYESIIACRNSWYKSEKEDGYTVKFTHEIGVKIPTIGELILDDNE